MGSVENRRKRLEDLERRFGVEDVVQMNVVQGDDDEPLYSFLMTRSGQRFGESFERDFERSLRYARSRVEEGSISRADLVGAPPITIAAVYAVLAARGEVERAEEVRELYEEERESRSRHYTFREFEEMAPGVGEEVDKWFWEMVERHAQKLSP